MTCNTMGFGGQVKRRSASRMDSVGLTDLQNDMQHNGFRRPGETQEWFQDGFRRSYDLQKTYNTMGFGGQVKRRSASRMDSVGLMTSRMTCNTMGFGDQVKRGSESSRIYSRDLINLYKSANTLSGSRSELITATQSL